MRMTIHITEKTGYTRIPYSFEVARTFQDNRFKLDKVSVIARSIIEEDLIRAYHAHVPKRTLEEEEAEEREWDSIVSQPHVREALGRMSAEVRRQIASGEIEEGGFEIE
jgi:transposase InsO family protein